MTKANTKKAFRIISVFEIVFAICASFSWSGGYILQEFIHIDPTTFLHNIVVFVFEFYFIGFPLALIFSFILLSINSDKKIMPAKPLVLLCVCPFIFAAGMYSMVISQSNSFFLLGSLIISVVNIIIQIYFITEIKKSKNYTPPVEASESAVNKKRNTVKALAAINTALILITTACFMIPPWLSLYNLADISDASVPLIAPMALGIIFGSILLNENAKTGFLPARTVNAAFAFEFLFPIIIWISNKIQFELTFTGPDYTPENIRDNIAIKICSAAFSLAALTIAVLLIRGIVKMKAEPSYSALSHKKSSLWTLYVLNIFPATIYSLSAFDTGLSEICWETDYDFKIFDTAFYKTIDDFLEKINFYCDTDSFFMRLMVCAVLVLVIYALITNIGQKNTFSKGQKLFIFTPYIISSIPYLLTPLFEMFFYDNDIAGIVYGIFSMLGSIIFTATQIFIIAKLIKFSKVKKIA